jgi:hypothetical protein
MYPKIATTLAGLLVALAAAQSLGAFGGGSPTILSPVSVPLAIPALLGAPLPLVVLTFAGIFWLWCFQLFNGTPLVPRRTTLLLGVMAALSTASFAIGWDYGIRYQGLTYTITCVVASTAMLACCAFILWRARKRASFSGSVLLHTLTFVWLASYAFPYLGETP